MLDYQQTDRCRMEFLQRALDDDTAAPCGRCDNCAGPWLDPAVSSSALAAATGELVVALQRGFCTRQLPRALGELRRRYPRLEVTVFE